LKKRGEIAKGGGTKPALRSLREGRGKKAGESRSKEKKKRKREKGVPDSNLSTRLEEGRGEEPPELMVALRKKKMLGGEKRRKRKKKEGRR